MASNTVDGRPCYLVEGCHSSIEVMTHLQYQLLLVKEVQMKLCKRHIVITCHIPCWEMTLWQFELYI
jgi:hypothetical protein